MGRQMPWDDIPDTNLVPGGIYHCVGKMLEEVASSTGKLMYKAQIEIAEPQEHAGHLFFENFCIGSDEDPNADSVDTWKGSFAAKRYKKLLNAAQVPQQADMEQILFAFQSTQFLISVVLTKEKDGEYKGQDTNKLANFYKIGERPIGIDPKSAMTMKAGANRAAPAAVAPPVAAPVATAPNVPVVPAAPIVVPPAAPVAPVVAAPPAAAIVPPPPAAPAAPLAAGPAMPCNVCGQQIPMADYAAHVQAHQAGTIDNNGNPIAPAA